MSILIQRATGRIAGVQAARQILTGAGLSGGGDLSADRTLVNTGVLSLTGTANQVVASGGTGAITLSLPQSIHTGASPTFAGLTLGVTPLAIGSGGTGATSAADARTALGLGTMAVLSTPLSLTTNVNGTLQAAQFPALTGDLTTGAGALATTLATVNGNVGSFGSSTAIPNFTVNAKGLLTAAGTNAVVAPAGTLTGATLAAGVLASSLTSVGTLLNLTVTNAITGSISGNAATVTTNANLTGHITSTGNAAVLGSFSSAQLLAALTDETGTGAAVFGTAPTFTTSITDPLLIGGTSTTSPLTLRSTSGVGTTGADIIFQVGNNGATEAIRIGNNGRVSVGAGGLPGYALFDIQSSAQQHGILRIIDTSAPAVGVGGDIGLGGMVGLGAGGSQAIPFARIKGGNQVGMDDDYTGYFAISLSNSGASYVERLYLSYAGLGIATSTFGTSAVGVIGIGLGTPPSTSPADMIQIFATDLSAGNATLGLRTETAVATGAALVSTHSLSVVLNGTAYKIMLVAV